MPRGFCRHLFQPAWRVLISLLCVSLFLSLLKAEELVLRWGCTP